MLHLKGLPSHYIACRFHYWSLVKFAFTAHFTYTLISYPEWDIKKNPTMDLFKNAQILNKQNEFIHIKTYIDLF